MIILKHSTFKIQKLIRSVQIPFKKIKLKEEAEVGWMHVLQKVSKSYLYGIWMKLWTFKREEREIKQFESHLNLNRSPFRLKGNQSVLLRCKSSE